MTQSYRISPGQEHAKNFILHLPDNFEQSGEVIQDRRNSIKKFNLDTATYAVKYFKGMYFLNRLTYSLFRRSKASRSFNYASILRSKGIDSPTPIGWINTYSLGLLMQSYYVCEYYKQPSLHYILSAGLNNPVYVDRSTLFSALASFVSRLHNERVFHNDLSLGNILLDISDGKFNFSLVDLNRIKFKKVSYREGLSNFAKLEISEDDMSLLINSYAQLHGRTFRESIDMFQKDKARANFLRNIRKSLRRYTLTPLEKFHYRLSNPPQAL